MRLYTNPLFTGNVQLYGRLGYQVDREEPFKGGVTVHMSKQLISRLDRRAAGMILHGSCLYGSVRYEVERLDMAIAHCHCVTCRKAHAAAYASTTGIMREHFRWTAGEERLCAYEFSPGKLHDAQIPDSDEKLLTRAVIRQSLLWRALRQRRS